MNWSRIKTILIMILIFTNILLLKIYLDNLPQGNAKDYADILKLYAAKGVEITAERREFPKYVQGVAAELGTVPANVEEKLFEYFDSTDIVFNHVATSWSISSIWTEVPEIAPVMIEIGGTEAESYSRRAEAFLKEIGFDIGVQRFLFYEVGDILLMECCQAVVQDGVVVPLAEGSVKLYFDRKNGDRIVGISINKYLKINAGQNRSYGIISADEALFGALEAAPAGDELVEISVVYKLNDESLLVTNLVRGEMMPYYELRFRRSAPIYVRASR